MINHKLSGVLCITGFLKKFEFLFANKKSDEIRCHLSHSTIINFL